MFLPQKAETMQSNLDQFANRNFPAHQFLKKRVQKMELIFEHFVFTWKLQGTIPDRQDELGLTIGLFLQKIAKKSQHSLKYRHFLSVFPKKPTVKSSISKKTTIKNRR